MSVELPEARILAAQINEALASKRVAVLTNSGGPAVMLTDELEELGLSVPEPSPYIREKLGFLPPFTSIRNPIDLTVQGNPDDYTRVLEALCSEEYYDAGIVVCVPPLSLDASEVARAIVRAAVNVEKSIIACFMAGRLVENAIPILEGNNIPNYPTANRTARALCVLTKIKGSTAEEN